MRYESYQIPLIVLGIAATALIGIFFWREVSPEYKIYQSDYIALEKFRSSYTGEPSPEFSRGIKQIVLEREDKGPPTIDRCTSCHIALQFPHFSPTRVAHDINGNIIFDEVGIPIQETNPDYIWAKLDAKIHALTDEQVNQQLQSEGDSRKVAERIKEAKGYAALKTATVNEQVYDVTKVLQMHPLIGKETRPFEFHPIDEYGCVSCHNGNGRGLTTDKAHGPVFDGTYHTEFIGAVPQFLESDPNNDPRFSTVFNAKPGHQLLFQTEPIYVGTLIEAKCMQCHQTTQTALVDAVKKAVDITNAKQDISKNIKGALENEQLALIELLNVRESIQKNGLGNLIQSLEKKKINYTLPPKMRKEVDARLDYLHSLAGVKNEDKIPVTPQIEKQIQDKINAQLLSMLGSESLVAQLEKSLDSAPKDKEDVIHTFLSTQQENPQANGSLFKKLAYLNLEYETLIHFQDTQSSFVQTLEDQSTISSIKNDIDFLTKGFHRGQDLFISQACYACHRVAGFARGGVGPDLSLEGKSYPWFVKQSIVWPQADLKTSTMPNFHLDHTDLEPLLTYVLAQTGENKSISDTAYKTSIQEWEAGRKLSWEKPITPVQMHDLRYAMTIFATQGCAACHRLKGFESNVGYTIEKEKGDKLDFEPLYQEKEWFKKLFPEMVRGSEIVQTLEQNKLEIDQRLRDHVRSGSILEEIETFYPETIESFYENFHYASRAKNHEIQQQIDIEKDPGKKNQLIHELEEWKQRTHRVLMMYIQEYGLGRLIGPRPNWAGVYRSDEWLMEHFHKPTAHVARSIMPVFPFDDTKFYALTNMLDVLGKKNRDELRIVWQKRGFNPEFAYQTYCSQCHGEFLSGNGPVSLWIYPIPKNLRNSSFLRNLTKSRVINSIYHGVRGTPMPPWGEVGEKTSADGIPVLSPKEINLLADWLFSNLPGQNVIKSSEDVPKWQYTPKDVMEELKREGHQLKERADAGGKLFNDSILSLSGEDLYADLNPKILQKPLDNTQGPEIFDLIKNPDVGPDKNFYYIKQKYITSENIAAGKAFFELNCAVCHGVEADGSGIRGEVMQDAKPRMLTNLDWLESRDDLRLLRSIKYGVPGTSMTPWGDLTSSLQRLQLVMFIRSISAGNLHREELQSLLYRAFGNGDMVLQEARIQEYKAIDRLKQEVKSTQILQSSLAEKVAKGEAMPKEAAEVYQKQLELRNQLEMHQEADQLILTLRDELFRERKYYEDFGLRLIDSNLSPELLKVYFSILTLEQGQYQLQEGNLVLEKQFENEKIAQTLSNQIVEEISALLLALMKEKEIIQGKLSSPEKNREMSALTDEISKLTKLKNQMISTFQEILRSKEKQFDIFEKFQHKIKQLSTTNDTK